MEICLLSCVISSSLDLALRRCEIAASANDCMRKLLQRFSATLRRASESAKGIPRHQILHLPSLAKYPGAGLYTSTAALTDPSQSLACFLGHWWSFLREVSRVYF